MEPITRQEQLLDSIATGDSVELEPITREEQYLSAIAGSTDFIPEKPITRKEMFYEKILESGGVGGDGTAKPTQAKTIEVVENGTYKVTPDSGKVLSSVTAKVNIPERYEEGFQAGVDSVKLQEKTVTKNGDVLPDEGFNGMSKVTVAVPTGSSKEEQEKSITITKNGTTEVIPDEGKTLSKVTIETNVATGGSGEVGKPYIDTSKMTRFASLFSNNSNLDLVDYLDTKNGLNFESMFSGSNLLKRIPPLNTSKGLSFKYMFQSCSSLKSIPLIDISNASNSFTRLFYGCTQAETISITTTKIDFSTDAFQSCTALTNLTIGEGWAVSIYLTYSNNLSVESLHGMIENLADLTGATAKTFQVGATNLAKIDEDHIAMLQAKNWNYS